MTRAMLLCAGYGTRLGPLSDERPKPMLPVCNLPILRYGIALLVGHGVKDIVINLHHRGQIIEQTLGDGSAYGARIRYVYERELLGTGGGLKNALDLLDPDGRDEPFLSLNGKLIFDVDLHELIDTYQSCPDALGVMVVRAIPTPEHGLWGAVDVDTSGPIDRVTNILGPGGYMFGGVHITRPSVVRRLPAGEACMVRQGYLPWLQAGEFVAALQASSSRYFAEHSTPKRYLASNLALLGGAKLRFPPADASGASGASIGDAGALGEAAIVDERAQVHSSATILPPVRIGAGVTIGAGATVGPQAVVAEDAVIEPGATVERAVVWPGAQVAGHHRDCIITPTAVVDASQE